jgi:diguanylate cyclase (GGDEF)-like protein
LVLLTALICAAASAAGLTSLSTKYWLAAAAVAGLSALLGGAVAAGLCQPATAAQTDVSTTRAALQECDEEIRAQNLCFEMALENMCQGVCVFDAERRLVVCNEPYLRMYGLTRERVKRGTTLSEILELRIEKGMYSSSREEFIRERLEAVRAEKPSFAIHHLTDGRIMRVGHQPIPGGGWVATHEEVTEREKLNAQLAHQNELLRQREQELNARNEQLDAAMENMLQGLAMFDADQRLIVCNKLYAEMYGLTPEQVAPGTTVRQIFDYRLANGTYHIKDAAEFVDRWASDFGDRSSRIQELADGRVVCVSRRRTASGGRVVTHHDITEQRRIEAQIEHMALHDALTGLPNRVLLRQRLEQATEGKRDCSALAVLCLDLDRFKDVNDTLGHAAGDELLKTVADRLRSCVRAGDTVARASGDEFVIVQVSSDPATEAAALATRIIEVLGAPFDLHNHRVVVGASIGIAVYPQDGTSPDTLLKHADLALYRSKSETGGIYCFFEQGMNARMQLRCETERDLRKALANREFELHFQPLVNLERNAVSGFEALLRWCHPERGMIMPSDFIPLAEETGLIVPIGEWVVRQACIDAATWPDHITVAVNLSPVQFKSRTLVQTVVNALATSGLRPGRLELEITESALLQDNEKTLASLRQLHNLGVRIALDDFGTGYSSLGYLRSFPFDKIKIDRCFIADLAKEGTDSLAIVRAVARMGGALGMSTTAEGVETQAQLEQVRAEGCTEIQGYIFSAPKPATDITRLFFSPGEKVASAA